MSIGSAKDFVELFLLGYRKKQRKKGGDV